MMHPHETSKSITNDKKNKIATGVALRRMSKTILVNANFVRKINKVRRRKCLVLTDTPEKPFEKCILDIGLLSITNEGNKYILTFQGSLKFSKANPIENQETSTIAKAFVTKIIMKHGIPEKILMDQGTNFTSELFKNVCKLLKIEKIQTYHPESNGALERSH